MLGLNAEEIVGVQVLIAQELPQASMKGIGAGFCNHINVGPGIAPIGGVVLAGLDFEFLNRIWIGNGHAATEVATALQVIDLDSIHLKIIIAGGAAIHDKVVVYASTANLSGVENLGADA